MNKPIRTALVLLFFLSGFSGLIYESIWTHYLKLFLGHAAYAQTLVLIIFMGGMAIGSWISTRLLHRNKLNLLLAYAAAEGLIGVLALFFHHAFIGVTDFSFNTAIPALGNPSLINTYKWLLGALLITPQSILLGATFPLMSSGFVRYTSRDHGSSIATLYFVNSLGACLGVLTSGFFLIKAVGLPGTIMTAGIINILISCIIWLIVTKSPLQFNTARDDERPPITNDSDHQFLRILLLVAALTGLSSFIYEIIWIRMLSLVLGSSTHSFELMLSAFILGLALGSLFIRNKIDNLSSQLKALIYVQLIMGLLAASTVLFYNYCFAFMAFLFQALQKNDQGYVLFNLSSHFLASLIMLPTTICAGMTLPLITKILLQKHHGEKSIGYVYSINTFGAILGVIVTIHLLLPYLGLKNSLMTGAFVDVLVSLLLLGTLNEGLQTARQKYFVLGGLALLGIISVTGSFNLHYMASGVFRYGFYTAPYETVYHREGKTATIDLTLRNNELSIRTNGKPDANISLDAKASPDEPTMRLIAFIPLSINPAIKNVANIGFGSGLSAHSVLAVPSVNSLDIVEIEPAIIDGARFFGKATERAYKDPRSHIYIDDAKTFFTSHETKYDLIISEPSNPWVSGVSSLFTTEFYQHTKRHLTSDGMLAQWVHSYEINDQLLGSIIRGISDNFDDYQIYMVSVYDLLIIAKPTGKIGAPDPGFYTRPELQAELSRIDVKSIADIQSRFLGDKASLYPYLQLLGVPANSDYFPLVDQSAAATRFKNVFSEGFANKLPIYNMLNAVNVHAGDITRSAYNLTSIHYLNARLLLNRLVNSKAPFTPFGSDEMSVTLFEQFGNNCNLPDDWSGAALWVASNTIPYLPPADAEQIWEKIQHQACYGKSRIEAKTLVNILRAFSARDYQQTLKIINAAANTSRMPVYDLFKHPFFMEIVMISQIQLQDFTALQAGWSQLPPEMQQRENLRFLMATGVLRNKSAAR